MKMDEKVMYYYFRAMIINYNSDLKNILDITREDKENLLQHFLNGLIYLKNDFSNKEVEFSLIDLKKNILIELEYLINLHLDAQKKNDNHFFDNFDKKVIYVQLNL